jgi:hypothetical protein
MLMESVLPRFLDQTRWADDSLRAITDRSLRRGGLAGMRF